MNITKAEFIQQLVQKHNYTKGSAKTLVNDFLDLVVENMEAGNAVSFYGFGCFDLVERAARSCPDPQTRETCYIDAHWVPRFYAGEQMRRAVKKWEDAERRGVG